MKIEKKIFFLIKKFFEKNSYKKIPISFLIDGRFRAASTPSFRKFELSVLNDTPFLDDHNGAATTAVSGSHVRHRNRNTVRKTKT